MSESQDDSQKTEEPTQHRLSEAEKKGQIPYSREVNNFFVMVALALMVAWVFPDMLKRGKDALVPFIASPEDVIISTGSLRDLLIEVLMDSALILMMPLALIIFLVVGAALLQSRFIFAVERIKPKMEKISVVKGAKRMFSMRSVVEFIKGIIKLAIISVVSVMAIHDSLPSLEEVPTYEPQELLLFLADLSMRIMVGACCVMFLVAIADYVYQRHEFMKQMRMSKQEIKDEYKQQEGDPHIKGKLKQLRMERARQRMMAAVPTANVVITNPTHYAVALKYETGLMQAPILVAKGVDAVAFRIRDLAKEHDIPIVENPPLARTLHANVDLDQEIPYEHYKAVAEVISYVYRLKGKLR